MRSQRVSVCVVDVERSSVLTKWQQAPIPSSFSHPTVLKYTRLVAFRRLLTSRKSLIRGLFSFGTRTLDQCYLTNDADGNENVKNTIGLIRKQQFHTCITLFCIFLSRFCTTTSWKCLISRLMEGVNKKRRNFSSFSELGYGDWKFSFRRVCVHLTK